LNVSFWRQAKGFHDAIANHLEQPHHVFEKRKTGMLLSQVWLAIHGHHDLESRPTLGCATKGGRKEVAGENGTG
jgi:hypothetical protein